LLAEYGFGFERQYLFCVFLFLFIFLFIFLLQVEDAGLCQRRVETVERAEPGEPARAAGD
jgi:hypothetical protein